MNQLLGLLIIAALAFVWGLLGSLNLWLYSWLFDRTVGGGALYPALILAFFEMWPLVWLFDKLWRRFHPPRDQQP